MTQVGVLKTLKNWKERKFVLSFLKTNVFTKDIYKNVERQQFSLLNTLCKIMRLEDSVCKLYFIFYCPYIQISWFFLKLKVLVFLLKMNESETQKLDFLHFYFYLE